MIQGTEHAALFYLGGGNVYLEEFGRLCFCPRNGRPGGFHSTSCDEAWAAFDKSEKSWARIEKRLARDQRAAHSAMHCACHLGSGDGKHLGVL